MGDNKKAYFQVDNAAFPNAAVPSTYPLADDESLAEYTARRYPKTSNEYVHYIEYDRNYFTQQTSAGNSIILHQKKQMDAASSAAAVAHSAIQQMHANKSFYKTTHMSIPNGTDGKRYPVPDVSKYTYNNKSTGYQYQYNVSTGLYYNPNSRYYWNSVIKKDQEKLTYGLAPSSYDYSHQTAAPAASSNQKPETKKHISEKQDEVKVAKKIGKDISPVDEEPGDEVKLLDHQTLNCYLCKRQLVSAAALTKHAKVSKRHKQNIEARKPTKKLESSKEKVVYRDRAKERRMKYGDPDEPQPSKLKKKYLKNRKLAEVPATAIASVSKPIGAENVGNRLLQKMGWTEGQGLGKQNQGRTTIIQAEHNSSTVGLGYKVTGYWRLLKNRIRIASRK